MAIDGAEYRQWDAVEMARLVRAGEVRGDELAETALALAERHAALNAVAELADPLPPATEGPFAGVPFMVKELLAWPGLRWTMGSRLLAGNPSPGHSPYSFRLQDLGLRVLASTTSSEFGLLGSTETALHGVTLNPWRQGLSAGGSSGGSAALVTAGVVPMAHGSDAGGSLRVPASLTGLVGFKPSNRRCLPSMPDDPGFAALVVEHVMTRTVRDSAHMLAHTERNGADAAYPPVGLVEGPDSARLRVGVLLPTLLGEAPDPAVRREVERVARLCAELGHTVDVLAPLPVDGAALSRAFFASAALTLGQVAAMVTPMLGRAPGPDELEPFTLELLEWGSGLGPDALAGAEAHLAAGARAYLSVFDSYDVVLSPTLARVSWPIGHLSPSAGRETLVRRTEEAVGYTPIHNIAGCPAISLPLGAADGLPVGIHFAARPGADRLVLALAYELEEAAPWADVRPDLGWLERDGAVASSGAGVRSGATAATR